MAGTINRAALKEHLWPGIVEFFGMEYQDYEEQYSYVFTTRQSRKAYEEYVMESAFGLAPPKSEGNPIMFDTAGDVWKGRVEMVAYALGFIITREAVNDDQYFDMVPRYTRALKRSMKITKEVRAASFIDGVFGTQRTGDGEFVCSTAHPLKSGATFSNRAAAPADLNETSLEAALIQIANFVDERGLRIAVQAQRLVVPNELTFVAERLMRTTTGRVGTGDNDVAAIHTSGMIPGGYRVNNYLSDPAAWFLITNVSEGMTHWQREELDLEEGDGSETQTMKVMAYERYAFSAQDPRGIFGAPG
jgi:hypothetical protein